MDFIGWHYSAGIKIYFESLQSLIQGTLRLYSLPILIDTLFAPWKRLSSHSRGSGFSFQRAIDNISFNTVSRFMGFLVRSTLIIVAIVTTISTSIIGLLFFPIW